MKTALLRRLAVMLPLMAFFFGCQTQEMDVFSDQIPGSGDVQRHEVTITADLVDETPDTRTSSELTSDGKTRVYWSPGDQIKIFSKDDASVFTSQNTVPSRTAQFKGDISMVFGDDGEGENKEYIWGLYPNREDATYEEVGGVSADGLITTTLPAIQQGKEDSFADNTFITIGRSEESLRIPFKGVCTGIYVTFTEDTDITAVTLKGLDNEPLAGRFKVGMSESSTGALTPVINSIVEPEYSVTVTAPGDGTFKKNKLYYIITLPVKFTRGFSVTARKASGLEGTYTVQPASAPEFKMNQIGSLKRLNERITTWTQSTTQGLNEIWYTTSDGSAVTYTVENKGNVLAGDPIAPDNNGGIGVIRFTKPVVKIDDNAFSQQTKLTSVTLPECVETIGTQAFRECSNLSDVSLGSSLKTIEEYAFKNCYALTDIDFLPEGLEEIGDLAFYSCRNASSATIPSTVTTLGLNPFNYCYGLQSFRGKFATDDGKALAKEDADGQVHFICFAAASTENETYIIPDVDVIDDYGCFRASFNQVILPENLKSIGEYAFSQCTNLTSVTIPASVREIHRSAFNSCNKLDWVKLKRTGFLVEPVPGNDDVFGAFNNTHNCPIYVPSKLLETYKIAPYWSAYAGRFQSEQGNNVIWYKTSDGKAVSYSVDSFTGNELDGVPVAPEDTDDGVGVIRFTAPITEIDEYAFYNQSNLTSVSLPDEVETIGEYAFSNCGSLTEINFGSGINTIREWAFDRCGFETLSLPEGLETIECYAFNKCENLRTVDIPKSAQNECLGSETTNTYSALITLPSYGNPFSRCPNLERFNSDLASSDGRCLSFETDDGDKVLLGFATAGLDGETYTLPTDITEIRVLALSKATFSHVILPSRLTAIHELGFDSCDNLEDLTLPSTLNTVKLWAFNGCSNLQWVKLLCPDVPVVSSDMSSSLPFIFSSTGNLLLYVPFSLIDDYEAAPYWSDLAGKYRGFQALNEIWYTVTDGSNGADLDFSAFVQSGEEVSQSYNEYDDCWVAAVDHEILYIPEKAFKNQTILKTIQLSRVIYEIRSEAFMGCTNLVGMTNPDATGADYINIGQWCQLIGDRAFKGCTSITDVFAIKTNSVGKSAFAGCSKLGLVQFGAVEEIKDSTFYQCSKLKSFNAESTAIADKVIGDL